MTSRTWQSRAIFKAAPPCEIFVESLLHYRDNGAHRLQAFVLMPDHFHVLLTPGQDTSLERAVQFIKGGSGDPRAALISVSRLAAGIQRPPDSKPQRLPVAHRLHRNESSEETFGREVCRLSLVLGLEFVSNGRYPSGVETPEYR